MVGTIWSTNIENPWLQENLNHIAFGEPGLEIDLDDAAGRKNLMKLFRIAQLIIQYLFISQEFMEKQLEESQQLKGGLKEKGEEVSLVALRTNLWKKLITMDTYHKRLLKMSIQGQSGFKLLFMWKRAIYDGDVDSRKQPALASILKVAEQAVSQYWEHTTT